MIIGTFKGQGSSWVDARLVMKGRAWGQVPMKNDMAVRVFINRSLSYRRLSFRKLLK